MSVESLSLVAPEGAHSPSPGALRGALIQKSPYRTYLLPIAADVERVAPNNRQVRAALEALAARSAAPSGGWLRRKDADVAVVRAFLDHVAFASPAFLGSGGEWPLKQIRGRS